MPSFFKQARRWLPGALISIVLIGAIRSADYAILGASVVLGFGWMLVRAVAWRTLLRDRASYRHVLLSLGEGYLLNNILPVRLGELGRAFLLSRKTDLQFVEIPPTLIIERAMDIAYTAAIFLAALPF